MTKIGIVLLEATIENVKLLQATTFLPASKHMTAMLSRTWVCVIYVVLNGSNLKNVAAPFETTMGKDAIEVEMGTKDPLMSCPRSKDNVLKPAEHAVTLMTKEASLLMTGTNCGPPLGHVSAVSAAVVKSRRAGALGMTDMRMNVDGTG